MEYNSGSNLTSPITPELYDTKSYYQLIVPITKCENLSLGIVINVRSRFQSNKMTLPQHQRVYNRKYERFADKFDIIRCHIGEC